MNLTGFAKRYFAIIAFIAGLGFLAILEGGDMGQVQRQVNWFFGNFVAFLAKVLFFDFFFFLDTINIPVVVIVLVGGALFFTFRFTFINIRGFAHAISVVRGTYDDPDAPGEVSHFQALSSALSATVGLGNIAGVAIAVSLGGPGAVFWMMVAAFFGMVSKFAECTLGQMYRQVDENGEVRGGPMVYLKEGLTDLGFPKVGTVLSVLFAVLCIGGSFGGGNMFQANQSFAAMSKLIPALGGERAEGTVVVTSSKPHELELRKHLMQFKTTPEEGSDAEPVVFRPVEDVSVQATDWAQTESGFQYKFDVIAMASGPSFNLDAGIIDTVETATVSGRDVEWTALEGASVVNADKTRGGTGDLGWLYGMLLAVLVGIVIIGGIKRIGKIADKIVPVMVVMYVISAMAIILLNASEVPGAVAEIFRQAFSPDAAYGGFIGVLIQGVRRAAFSNEAGVGSAAIAHSAAKTKEPIREGLVALLEPFIDTIVVCFMTGSVIVVTGVYADPATAGLDGVLLTGAAFDKGLAGFADIALSVAVVLFAFSTMISWSYYGERCWSYLFGNDQTQAYRILFCIFVWVGCVSSLGNVLDFSDLMILSMAFPNIIGVVWLSGKVRRALDDYWERYKNDEFTVYK